MKTKKFEKLNEKQMNAVKGGFKAGSSLTAGGS
ncbi:MAG: bacteriocin [Bacteroidales bacterium]|nr:bacteriocin [Bacteroidales bacterium]